MQLKRNWQLGIVIVGTIGLLAYFIDDAFFSELTNPLGSVRLFRYFTILANLLTVVYFWMMYTLRYHLRKRWFDHFLGGIAIYLFLTFIMYALFLEGTYEQSTLDVIGNICLHYGNPALVIGYYVYQRQNYTFVLADIIVWFVFPVVYLVFLSIHGIVTGDYLYSFFQVADVGIVGFLSMIGVLFGVFFLLAFVLVKIVSQK